VSGTHRLAGSCIRLERLKLHPPPVLRTALWSNVRASLVPIAVPPLNLAHSKPEDTAMTSISYREAADRAAITFDGLAEGDPNGKWAPSWRSHAAALRALAALCERAEKINKNADGEIGALPMQKSWVVEQLAAGFASEAEVAS
jgi:hypothetical protein